MHLNYSNSSVTQSINQSVPVSLSRLLQVPLWVAWAPMIRYLTQRHTPTLRRHLIPEPDGKGCYVNIWWAARGGYIYSLPVDMQKSPHRWIQVRLWALNPAHVMSVLNWGLKPRIRRIESEHGLVSLLLFWRNYPVIWRGSKGCRMDLASAFDS